MSIAISKQPRDIDFSGNPLKFKLSVIEPIVSSGSPATLIIFVDGATYDGDEMELTFLGQTHKFWLSESDPLLTPPSGFNWVLTASSDHTEAAADLASYTPLSDYYDITSNQGGITITAKNNGPVYNLSADLSLVNPYTIYSNEKGVADVNADDYHVLALVFLENMSDRGTYSQIPSFRLDPLSEEVEIDLSPIIHRRLKKFYELPEYDLSTMDLLDLPAMDYYVQFIEMRDDQQLSIITSSTLKALKGKINNRSHPTFDLITYLQSSRSFLSNQPQRIYTYIGAKHFLYWMNPFSSMNVFLKLKGYTADKSAYEIDYIDESGEGVANGEVLIIPVHSYLSQQRGGDYCRYLEVSLVDDAGDVFTPVQSFVFLPKRLWNKSILFQNRLGEFDTLPIYSQENQLKIDRDENTLLLQSDYDVLEGDLSSDETTYEDTFTANSGSLTRQMAQHYKELLLSEAVFIDTESGYLRIKILKGTFNITNDADNLHTVEFKYKGAFTGDLINDTISLPDIIPAEDYSEDYNENDYNN